MRDISLLHPQMRAKCEALKALCAANGLPVLITQTWRTEAEQTALYAQGRTSAGSIVTNCKYPYSPHCWGVAFDFCRNIKGKEYDDSYGFFAKVGALGKSIGLFWGGDFKSFVDKPHLELPDYLPNNSVKTLIKNYGTPEKFKASWEDNVTKEDAIKIIKNKASLSDATITYLDSYRYGDELIEKLANAMKA